MILTELQSKVVAAGEGASVVVPGMDDIRIKLSGADTAGVFMMSEHTNPPGRGVPMHVHRREDETFYVVEGEVELRVGNDTIIARAGDTAFLPRDIPHSWRIIGNQVARMLVVASPAGLDDFFTEVGRLGSDAPPDIARVLTIASRYGIEFVLPES